MSPSHQPHPANDTAPLSATGPRRHAHLDAVAAAAAQRDELAASFCAATRRGDIIGEMLRAAHGRVAASRGSKASDTVDEATQAAALRRDRCAALLAGLIEVATYGVGRDSALLAAFGTLLPTLDADVRPWAQRRVDYLIGKPRTKPVRMDDLGALKARLAALRTDAAVDSGPPSGRRPSTAWLQQAIALRRAAAEALGEFTGDMVAGCYRLGGVQLPREVARELSDMTRELSGAAVSGPHIARMAEQAAKAALGAAKLAPALRTKADAAAAALGRLEAFVGQGGGR